MLDPFNRRINYLRISVTDRCNLRCTYCMPAEGMKLVAHEDILRFEEIRELVRIAVTLGVSKVRLTGGEPLVRRGIVDLVGMLAELPGVEDLALTTNAVLLRQFAEPLRQAGLHRLNISLDSVNPERFRQITRNGELAEVLDGITAAMAAGFSRIKLNCVVAESPAEPDAAGVAAFAHAQGLEVRFIRCMDTARGLFWPVIGGDGGHCQLCNRLRVTSNGMVYPCLFSDRSFSIRALGAEAALQQAVATKPAAGDRSRNQFYTIGG